MKHEIEIPDLPEGWRAVAYREPVEGEYYLMEGIHLHGTGRCEEMLIVEKIPPRRIVLEETYEFRKAKPNEYYEYFGGISQNNRYTDSTGEYKIWRVVEEGE